MINKTVPIYRCSTSTENISKLIKQYPNEVLYDPEHSKYYIPRWIKERSDHNFYINTIKRIIYKLDTQGLQGIGEQLFIYFENSKYTVANMKGGTALLTGHVTL